MMLIFDPWNILKGLEKIKLVLVTTELKLSRLFTHIPTQREKECAHAILTKLKCDLEISNLKCKL